MRHQLRDLTFPSIVCAAVEETAILDVTKY